MSERIEHSGRVDRVEGGTVYVTITSSSACGSCKARQACGLAETQEKIVAVATPDAASYAPGDAVTVGVRRSAGALAVALAYGGALVVLLATLVATVGLLGWSEAQGALSALAAVALYYVVLWVARRGIEHTIHFTIFKN
ncbi:MAG: SoxR reducing system RseC family protein [Alistipes sp.]|nr:SoxR reducing system RseC family protein [Alistipes sp.]